MSARLLTSGLASSSLNRGISLEAPSSLFIQGRDIPKWGVLAVCFAASLCASG